MRMCPSKARFGLGFAYSLVSPSSGICQAVGCASSPGIDICQRDPRPLPSTSAVTAQNRCPSEKFAGLARASSNTAPSRMSSVDEVLTLLSSNRRPHLLLADLPGQKHVGRRAAVEPVALMQPLPIVEAQVRLQVLLQLRDAPVVRPAKGDTPQLGEDGPLQPFDEAVCPGVARAGAPVADAELPTGRDKACLPLGAAIGEHRLDPVPGPLVGRHHVPAQELDRGLLGDPRDEGGDPIGAGRIARRQLPDLADPLELPDVEGVEADQVARALGLQRAAASAAGGCARSAGRRSPRGLPGA